MVQTNLGKLDRVFRFLLGAWWISPLAPVYSLSWVNWVIFIVGWIALAESFVGWCWLHDVLKINHKKD